MTNNNSAAVVKSLPLWMQNYRLTSNSPKKETTNQPIQTASHKRAE
ncbi:MULTISPECIES: hypothetical protein [Shewanella]|nr:MULTISPECIES: hypothetical protein [Shewanella]NCQ45153.1 hypothetical protein [Shewanella frigidimarina]NCO70859.1 hypothetical protein [Shewanella vesiculosa]NCP36976.1 hypothetical protein [Shewanella vesiculosa]NCP68931.1 hypothetical protein [Shewanella vesiculosa]NCP74313.1 hypothetical protein [Shewanella vesiculosa]